MALDKVTYVDGVTVIGADNLNDIQDAIIANENATDYALAAYPTDTASGSIVSIPDGADNIPVKAMTVQIEPSQDLNGYDHPWPAGGGANRLNESDLVTGAWLDNSTGTYQYNPSGYGTRRATQVYQPCASSTAYYFAAYLNGTAVSDTYALIVCWYDSSKAFISAQNANVTPHAITSPSNAAFFRLGVLSASHTVAVNYPSTVTTYSPYSNECPISGWTGANIYDTGINIMDEQFEIGMISVVDGQNVADNSVMRTINYIPVKPNTTYYYRAPALAAVHYYDENKTWLGYSAISENSPFTTPENAFFVRLRLGAAYGTTYNHDVAILYPSTNTSYVPFNASSTNYTVDWTDEAGEVFYGTVDPITGDMVDDTVTIDLSQLTWTSASYGYYSQDYAPLMGNQDPTQFVCTSYKSISASDLSTTPNGIAIGQGSHPKRICVSSSTTPTGTLVAHKATPTTTTITPVTPPITTLLGNNNVWADCGPVELNYRADVGLYIDKKLGA